MPIAASGTIEGELLVVEGMVASVDGRRLLRDSVVGSVLNARGLGEMLAEKLLTRGAGEIVGEAIA